MFCDRVMYPQIDGGCLEGIACPKCGHNGGFHIYASSWFRVYADGVEDSSDVEWDDGSPIRCLECSFEGTLREFTEPSKG